MKNINFNPTKYENILILGIIYLIDTSTNFGDAKVVK